MAIITGTPLDDLLNGTNKADTIYGDMVSLSFSVQSSLNVSQTFGGASFATPLTVTFANDTLNGGNGDDTLVGDVDTILLHAQSGDGINANAVTANSDAILENIKIVGGDDSLLGGNGSDTLYGDAREMTVESFAGIANGPAPSTQSASTRIRGITFEGGDDNLSGGNENDRIVGDIGTLSLASIGGQALGALDIAVPRINTQGAQANILTMGKDDLHGDNGNDTLVGDIAQFNMKAIAGVASGDLTTNQAAIRLDLLVTGDDRLDGGNGNDRLYGDIESVVSLGQGGVAPLSIAGENSAEAFISLNWTLGKDQIVGDNGNDLLVGDIGSISIKFMGGFTSTGNVFSSASAGEGVFEPVVRSAGDDSLSGGNGDDSLYGDIKSFDILLQGGTNVGTTISQVSAIGGLLGVTYAMGKDQLDGGNGNDTLVGDIGTFHLTANSGTGVGTTPTENNVHIVFGDDVLLGGNGNDALYGDEVVAGELDVLMHGYLWNQVPGTSFDARFPTIPNTVEYGDDILDGGNGNDLLIGDVLDMPGYNPSDPTNGSTVTWGDDILTGGKGADKFGFAIMDQGGFVTQGKDTITDFNMCEGDRMMLKVAADVTLADINGDTVFSHSAVGGGDALDTVATFFDGSSITLLDANIESFSAANTVLVH